MRTKRNVGILLKVLAIILLVTPIVVLSVLNKDEWIISEQTTTKLSLGFIIALLFCIGLLKGAFKSLDKRLITAATLLTFSVIVWLLDSIIQDLFWILLCAFIGYILYLIFDSIGSKLYETAKIYSQEKIRAQARNDFENQGEIKGSGRA